MKRHIVPLLAIVFCVGLLIYFSLYQNTTNELIADQNTYPEEDLDRAESVDSPTQDTAWVALSPSTTNHSFSSELNTTYSNAMITTDTRGHSLPEEIIQLIPFSFEVNCAGSVDQGIFQAQLRNLDVIQVENYLNSLPVVSKIDGYSGEVYYPELNIHKVCKTVNGFELVIYSYGSTAGGIRTYYIGVMNQTGEILVSQIIDSEKMRNMYLEGKGPYHNCSQFLITSTYLYIRCSGGDGGYVFSTLHKLTFSTNSLETLVTCHTVADENLEIKEVICD